MKRLLVLLACLLAVPAQGQILSIIMGGTNQPATSTNHARSFNGSSDYLQSASALSIGSVSTISLVFDAYKPSYTNSDSWLIASRTAFSTSDGTFYVDPDCSSPSGQFCVTVHENYGTLTCYFARPSAAAWHHYVIDLYSGGSAGTCTVYVDGSSVSVSYSSQTGNVTNFYADQIDVGQRIDYGPALEFVGYLSRIAIFTGSVSSANASAIASCGSPTLATSATLINYWPINQTSPELPTTGSINLNVSGTTNVASPCTF